MQFSLQPTHLKNEKVALLPLQPSDFDALYAVASDPLIWEQHPSPNRYKEEEFRLFFEEAINSGGAFIIRDVLTNQVIGTSRYYEPDNVKMSVTIGYTFLARAYWGKSYNKSVKQLMIDYSFTYVHFVLFHIGAKNIRSQKAIEKLGAHRSVPLELSESEPTADSFIYVIDRESWKELKGRN